MLLRTNDVPPAYVQILTLDATFRPQWRPGRTAAEETCSWNSRTRQPSLSRPAGIDTVRGIHIGVPADTEQRGVVDGSYSASELLFFDDVAGQNAYQVHSIHKQFIADCEHLWERVVVYDATAVAP